MTEATGMALAPPRRGINARLATLLYRRVTLRGYLLLAPALLIMTAAIVAPLATILTMSFWSMSGYTMDTTPTLDNFRAMASHPMYSVLIGRSMMMSALATTITVIACYPMAYFVAFHGGRHKSIWLVIMTLPFWTSYLLRVFSWKVILGYEGLINSSLLSLGMIEQPLAVFLYSKTAVVVVLAHSWAVFALLPIYVSLESINKTYLEAAADLGDPPARRFWRIVFPLSLPGVAAAFFMMFIPTVGDYITPALVGGPDAMMVGNLIQANFGAMNNHPAGAALAVVMILTIVVAGLVFLGLSRLIRR